MEACLESKSTMDYNSSAADPKIVHISFLNVFLLLKKDDNDYF